MSDVHTSDLPLAVGARRQQRVAADLGDQRGVRLKHNLVKAQQRRPGRRNAGHNRMIGQHDLGLHPFRRLDAVVKGMDRDRQHLFDHGAVVLGRAVHTGEGVIAAAHNEGAAAGDPLGQQL